MKSLKMKICMAFENWSDVKNEGTQKMWRNNKKVMARKSNVRTQLRQIKRHARHVKKWRHVKHVKKWGARKAQIKMKATKAHKKEKAHKAR